MKPFNKEEYNKLCAEFMSIGYSEIHKGELNTSRMESEWMCTYANTQYECSRDDFPLLKPMDYLKFDTDWNWIMEVVEKIEEIYYLKPVHILGNQCNILTNKTFKVCRDSKKEAVVQAIWEFLNWYKENK